MPTASYAVNALVSMISICSFLAFIWGAVLALDNFKLRKTDDKAKRTFRRGLTWMAASLLVVLAVKALDLQN